MVIDHRRKRRFAVPVAVEKIPLRVAQSGQNKLRCAGRLSRVRRLAENHGRLGERRDHQPVPVREHLVAPFAVIWNAAVNSSAAAGPSSAVTSSTLQR